MSLPGLVPGMPRIGARVNAVHRIVFKSGQWGDADLPGGRQIAGACSRDPGNTPDLDVLRAGLLMGKITTVVNSLGTVGQFAPSILGVTTNAEAASSVAIEASAAVIAELVRRCGASGTFKLTGPPTANGTVATQTVTYSAASGTVITCTAISAAAVAGSFIQPTDGSEDPFALIADGWGVKVTDIDNVTSLVVPFSPVPIGAVLYSNQILPAWPTDTSLRTWIVNALDRNGGGKFVFDHIYS